LPYLRYYRKYHTNPPPCISPLESTSLLELVEALQTFSDWLPTWITYLFIVVCRQVGGRCSLQPWTMFVVKVKVMDPACVQRSCSTSYNSMATLVIAVFFFPFPRLCLTLSFASASICSTEQPLRRHWLVYHLLSGYYITCAKSRTLGFQSLFAQLRLCLLCFLFLLGKSRKSSCPSVPPCGGKLVSQAVWVCGCVVLCCVVLRCVLLC
jgi:hypothetical protein